MCLHSPTFLIITVVGVADEKERSLSGLPESRVLSLSVWMRVGQVTSTPFLSSHSCKILSATFSVFPVINDAHLTACLVIKEEDPKHVVVITDLLRYFETK